MKSKLIASLLAVSLITVGCSISNNNNSTTSSSSQESNKDNSKEVKLNTPIVFEKEAEITVKSAIWTDERNVVVDTKPEKVLLVTYDVKNLSDKDYAVGTELKLYVGGKKAETYPIKVTLESISSGRILENATQAFAVNGTGDLELEIVPSFSFKSDKKVLKLDLK